MKLFTSTSLSLLAVLLLSSELLLAQNCNPNIPIDGGISALLAAGAGYGIKKIYDSRKK